VVCGRHVTSMDGYGSDRATTWTNGVHLFCGMLCLSLGLCSGASGPGQ